MPNHVFNEITLHDITLDRASPLILNAEGKVDFGVLLPLPIHFWPGSVGVQHEKAFPGTHLDEATKLWGTKWNAYGDPVLHDNGNSSIITCQTAWSHPHGWICALFNSLKCDITSIWLDEGRTYAVRETWHQDGGSASLGSPTWEQMTIPEKSPDHRRLHKSLWGVEAFDEETA